MNLATYVKDGSFQWDSFKNDVKLSIRFLDDILSVNEFPLDSIKQRSMNERRVGLGLMGLHTAMLLMGTKYSSNQGMEFVEKIYECMRNASYVGSVELAVEKGSFPLFETEAYLNSGFAKTLPTKIRKLIREHGIRNVCVNTQAPTGTTSMVANVSSGIEPIFAPMYDRRFRSEEVKEGFKVERVIDPLLKSFIDNNKGIGHFEGAYDVKVEDHLEVQEIAQRYVDSSISKTINLPEDYPVEDLSEIWLKYADQLKGTTLYRSGSRGEEPLKPIESSVKELKRLVKEEEVFVGENVDMSCPNGICNL
jgi:ribonucleoside-diphosphate reductase alpha chain